MPVKTEFKTGAVRDLEPGKGKRYDLMSRIGIRRYAETCHEGAEKYAPRNWEKGIPSTNLLNHAIDHLMAYVDGDRSEDHLAHAVWNVMATMDNEERRPAMMEGIICRTAAELNPGTEMGSPSPSRMASALSAQQRGATRKARSTTSSKGRMGRASR